VKVSERSGVVMQCAYLLCSCDNW